MFDPSVLVSAALSSKGAPRELLQRWMEGGFDLIVSPHLLHELQAVLAREKFRRHITYEEATEYVSWLHHKAEVANDPSESLAKGALKADPDDEYLIGLAGALESVTYLVSVDRHILDLPESVIRDGEGGFLARIATPGEFLRELDIHTTEDV